MFPEDHVAGTVALVLVVNLLATAQDDAQRRASLKVGMRSLHFAIHVCEWNGAVTWRQMARGQKSRFQNNVRRERAQCRETTNEHSEDWQRLLRNPAVASTRRLL